MGEGSFVSVGSYCEASEESGCCLTSSTACLVSSDGAVGNTIVGAYTVGEFVYLIGDDAELRKAWVCESSF